MSTSPRGNRSRLKQDSSDSPEIVSAEARLLPDLPQSDEFSNDFPPPASGGQQQPVPSEPSILQMSTAGEPAETYKMDTDMHNTALIQPVETGLEALSSVAAAELSDGGSSSLSELEYIGEDNEENASRSMDEDSSEESDSEAETERLEISPQKVRLLTGSTSQRRTNGDLPVKTNMLRLTSGGAQPTISRLSPSGVLSSPGHGSPISPDGQLENGVVRSPSDYAVRKRKRSDPLSEASSMSLGGEEPLNKRSHSSSIDGLAPRTLELPSIGQGGVEDDGSDSLSEVSTQSDLSATVENLPIPQDEAVPESLESLKGYISDLESEGPASDHDMVDVVDGPEDVVVKPEEIDEVAELDMEEDEGETAAKSEDELAKKKSALDALVPIENLFVIFRDQLFEERIAAQTQELELLNDPNTTHPEYIAMRQCLNQRRDEKIHLEHVGLFYKQKCLENTVLAARAQLHSQYCQEARAIREKILEKVNEEFCKIQRERRQIQNREPQFGYVFQARRSKQISQQAAYNKEVSILSGIARYVGFPGAPEMQGARSSETDEDFKAMQIKPLTASTTFPPQLASARATEGPLEDSFLERNPWANPDHPSHQQAMPTASSNPSNRVSLNPTVTPTISKRANNTTAWLLGDMQATSSLPGPGHSDSPSSNHIPPPISTHRTISNGPTALTSPFDHHPSARRENSNPNPTRARLNHDNGPTSSAPLTRPGSRFERPYRPKNMPPASFPLSPPQPLHTPMPRGGSHTPGFLHNSAITGLVGGVKDERLGRYASPARFGPLGGPSGAAGPPGSGAGRAMGVVEGLGLR